MTMLSASCQNGISSSQHDLYTQEESYRVGLQVAGVSKDPAMCNKLVRYGLFVIRDTLLCTPAEIE